MTVPLHASLARLRLARTAFALASATFAGIAAFSDVEDRSG
jgi:hypothetical protein